MKSIMQEASSIIKALEKAWLSAGQPKEFSVKVFEESEKNFLGMTTKSAKIGLFFQEVEKREAKAPVKGEVIQPSKGAAYEPRRQQPVRRTTERRQEARPEHPHSEQVRQEPVRSEQTRPEQPERSEQVRPSRERIIWNDEMVALATTWLTDALKAMEKPHISFVTNVNNYYLRCTFSAPLAETPEKERQVYRSFSFLMLQTLKKQLKRPLRGFKIVLTR